MDAVIDQLIRSRRKTVLLEITPDARLIVRAPHRLPKSLILKSVAERAQWIEAKKRQALARARLYPPIRGSEGDTVWFLGRSYRLSFLENVLLPELRADCLVLPMKMKEKALTVIVSWYKEQAWSILTGRVNLYAGFYSLAYKSLGITSAQKRWGSCGADCSLNFSWRLAMAPMKAIDYVVVHELAHTCHHNHSKDFWAKVQQMMPDYQAQKVWLCENSGILNAF